MEPTSEFLAILELTKDPEFVSYDAGIQIKRNEDRLKEIDNLLNKIEPVKLTKKEFDEKYMKAKMAVALDIKQGIYTGHHLHLFSVSGRWFFGGELVQNIQE